MKKNLLFLCFLLLAITGSAQTISGPMGFCDGTSVPYSATPAGGTWTCGSTAILTINSVTGVATGIAAGTTVITYTLPTMAFDTMVVTVYAAVPAIMGTATVCVGATSTLTNSAPGGTWSSSAPAVGTVGASTGVLGGITFGTTHITYTLATGCSATTAATVMPNPILTTGSFCIAASPTAVASPAGGTWSSSAPSIIGVGASTGVLTGYMAGTATITYIISSGCYATATANVMVPPVITITTTPDACGNGYTLTASGGTAYTWSPAGGLSCASCSSPTTSPTGPVTYTALDYTTPGCGASATVTLSGNRIYGHIAFTGMPPASPAMLVWLIQYNPADSSITGIDSVATCIDGGSPFYKFDGKPAGNYLVKARLNSAIPGTSDYIPTYGASTPNWFSAATITHAAATNVQDITMIYGTVPAGPGFISGYVYSGAGKGTAGEIPVEGMIVYLKNTAGDVLTYTYTNASGAYSFSSLAYGSYVTYPAEQSYYTTPSTTITLSAANPSAAGVTFKQYTTSGVILPWSMPTSTFTASLTEGTVVYPNPATGSLNISTAAQQEGTLTVSLTDVTGRIVFTTQADVNIKGQATADVSTVNAGIYMVRITSGNVNYTGKLLVQH